MRHQKLIVWIVAIVVVAHLIDVLVPWLIAAGVLWLIGAGISAALKNT